MGHTYELTMPGRHDGYRFHAPDTAYAERVRAFFEAEHHIVLRLTVSVPGLRLPDEVPRAYSGGHREDSHA